MNLDELQSVRDRERQTDKLQQLREPFYADAGEFIAQLRAERDRAAERAEDPFDAPEVGRLTDEIHTAEQTVEAIYEKRVGKIVKAASFAAADLPAESEGMTVEEQELFDTLVADIQGNRERVLDVLAGEGDDAAGTPPAGREPTGRGEPPEEPEPESEPAPGADEATPADSFMGETPAPAGGRERDPSPPERDGAGDSPPDAHGADRTSPRSDGGGQPPVGADSPGPSREEGGTGTPDPVERETVRITEDVGTFVGFDDREYDLGVDDVVRLPATNAAPLVERDAAQPLE